ncbi:hypothetical protein ACFCYX_26965 [Streptomyces populi]|uniref:hypothetical protein n=1 Tax=Streptomyces populi TaxID=2058924 RepID=UPI0013A6CCE2|nr:hypothetical protein [Streptomyces populi]
MPSSSFSGRAVEAVTVRPAGTVSGSSTGGSGSTTSGGTAQGSMAGTGAGAPPWCATAAGGASALGAALSVLARRRAR